MRALFLILVVGLAFAAPVASAEETVSDTSTTTTDPTSTSTDTGPEPTGCRPYCVEG